MLADIVVAGTPTAPGSRHRWGCGLPSTIGGSALLLKPGRARLLANLTRKRRLKPAIGARPPPICRASKWSDKSSKAVESLPGKVQELSQAVAAFCQNVSKHIKVGGFQSVCALLLSLAGALTAAANLWGIRPINARLQTQVGPQIAQVVGREVSMGQVNWLAPTGVIGMHPVASLGPVSIGPGAAEGSWAHLPEVRVSMDPLQSLLQHKLVLKLHAPGAQVDLVQASNLSWFGYPEDTIPSARDFLPGLHEAVPADGAEGAGARAHAEALQQQQAQARQALRDEQRASMAAPPDAAVNFSPAVGQDIISEGYMKPRSKAKPNFAQAAPSQQQQPLSSSSARALSPIPTSMTASDTGGTDNAHDACAERRASGQKASTSEAGPGLASTTSSTYRSGRQTYPARSRGRGRATARNGPPSAPFASISLHQGTALRTQTGHIPAANPDTAPAHVQQPSDSSHSSSLAQTDTDTATAHMHAQPRPQSAQLHAMSAEVVDFGRSHNRAIEQCPSATSSSEPAFNVAANPVGDLAAQDPWAVDKTSAPKAPEPPATGTNSTAEQCRPGPSAFPQLPHEPYAYSSASQTEPAQPRRPGPSAFPQLPHEQHAYSTFASRQAAHASIIKPGPSAFPQPTHEICLQRMTADLQSSAASLCESQPTGSAQVSSTPTHVQATDAQQPEWQAHTQQHGPGQQKQLRQQAMSHHGGYMQREGHERLPRRRTTRSILRGIDLQTGIAMDPGLATYHMRGVKGHMIDPVTDQQTVTAQSALEHQTADAEALQFSTTTAADQQKGLTDILADQEAFQKLQQALVKTQEVSKSTVDQLRSSAQDLQDKGRAAVDKGRAAMDHIRAAAPELTPANAQRGLQELGQAALEHVQAAATKVQQAGQGSLDQVRSTAKGLTQQAPWRGVSEVQWEPPSWLPRLTRTATAPAPQQNALVSPSTPATTAPTSHLGPVRETQGDLRHPAPAPAAASTGLPHPAGQPGSVHTQAETASAASNEQVVPAFRLHSSGQSNNLSTLPQPGVWTPAFTQDTISFPANQWHHFQAVESTIVVQSAADNGSQALLSSSAHAQLSDVASLASSSQSIGSRDQPEQHLAGSDRPHASQDPAAPAPAPSIRSGWERVERRGLGGEGITEPHYKPGVPAPPRGTLQISANADARLQRWLGQWGRAVLSKVGPPEIALDSITIRTGQCNTWVAGESVPRQFEQVDCKLTLGRDYQDLDLKLSAVAHERDPSQAKCTMLSPHGVRNLRGVTGGSLSAPPSQALPEADELGSVLSTSSGTVQGQDPREDTMQYYRQQRQRPTGGKLQLHVHSDGLIKGGDTFPDLSVTVKAQDLHAPLAERLVELPVDITAGRLGGVLKLRCNDAASWRFPSFAGRVACRGIDFHFWDAVDDLSSTDIDLVFDDQRLYMHNASGMFGSVPLTLSGDVDINPETGRYRLSGDVAGVEVNELRKTLGVRPTPYSVGGAVRGVLHVTGPLDQPVFSGTAVATAPTAEMLQASEDCAAKTTLQTAEGSVGAYDKVPLATASCLFSMDTSTDIFIMHSFQAQPMGGGQMLGSGRMWLAPSALEDPRAVKFTMQGQDLPTESLLKQYLPQGMVLPEALVLGPGAAQGSMQGSHTNPVIQATWSVPAAEAAGNVKLDKDAVHLSAKAPALDVSSTLHLKPPPLQAIKAAITQAEVTAASVPTLEGAEVVADFKGLDVLPLFSPASADNPPGQATRLKLTGHSQLSGRLSSQSDPATGQAASPSFEGQLTMDGLRVNQLKLSKHLSGTLQVSDKEVHIHAKGARADEALDIDLALPLFQPQPIPEPKQVTNQALRGILGPHLGNMADMLPVPRFASSGLLPGMRKVPPVQKPPSPVASEGGTFALRCGPLSVSAQVNASSSVVDAAVMGLQLDELELASLRGEVQEVSLSLNFDTRMGRGTVNVAGPRFSGLQGEALSGGVRWERDVIRLEKAVLQQLGSRYEVQGEYVIPPDTRIPDSAASMAQLPPTASPMDLMAPRADLRPKVPKSAFEQAMGRWRLQVAVPQADMEEIVPAARLLSRATAVSPSDYDRAKMLFLEGLQHAGVQAESAVQLLEEAVQQARLQIQGSLPEAVANSPSGSLKGTADMPRASVPGLQDLRGSWAGSLQAYGGGGGASNVDFDIKGTDWQWAYYKMDEVRAQGSCHSNEGLKLEELALRAEDAQLLVKGSLLGPSQDATLELSDFPVAMLQPALRAVPALNSAPAAGSPAPATPPQAASFHGLPKAFTKTQGKAGAVLPAQPLYTNSPISGLLDIHGTIGGSASVPEGAVELRLYEGAAGPTRLAQASATARLDSQQRLAFDCLLEPIAQARQTGHVKLSGSLPLALSGPSIEDITAAEDAQMGEVSEAAEAAAETIADPVAEGFDEAEDQEAPRALGPQDVEMHLHVKDAGMMLISTVAPDVAWQSGNADISFSVTGHQEQPVVEGEAQIRKASIHCTYLKEPMTNVHADVILANDQLQVEAFDAQCGKGKAKGHIKVKGLLPLNAHTVPMQAPVEAEEIQTAAPAAELVLDVKSLDLRVPNTCSGLINMDLQLQRSLLQPEIGGSIQFSKGSVSFLPEGTMPASEPTSAETADGQQAELISKAFAALQQSSKDPQGSILLRQPSIRLGSAQVESMLPQPAVADRVVLKGLTVELGPKAEVWVMNHAVHLQVSGKVVVTGPADPQKLQLQGTVCLDSGEVNLVATHLALDRDHSNKLVFAEGQGLNPVVDLKFKSSSLRALIQGRASTWQSNLTVTSTAASGGETAEPLTAEQVAKLFEGQLGNMLLADSLPATQASMANLFQQALHAAGVPRFQSQGAVGQTKWRINVGTQAFAGAVHTVHTGPIASRDPASWLTGLALGSEFEVTFGNSLQVSVSSTLKGSDQALEWAFNYNLHPHLRMQFRNDSASLPYPRGQTVFFQWNSQGASQSSLS